MRDQKDELDVKRLPSLRRAPESRYGAGGRWQGGHRHDLIDKDAFRNMLHNGLAQSERVIIRQCGLTDGYMIQQVEGQIRNGIPVSNIWVFNGQEVRLLLNTEG